MRTRGLVAIAMMLGLMALPTLTNANPFGIAMGAPIHDYEIAGEDSSTGIFLLRSVPKPHGDFNGYYGIFTEETGICAILADSKLFEDDPYGTDVRRLFESIHTALLAKYGHEDIISWLKPDALWDESREWVMSIKQNERYYFASWESSDHPQLAHFSLSNIELKLNAADPSSARVVLVYRGQNFDRCTDIINAKNNSAL